MSSLNYVGNIKPVSTMVCWTHRGCICCGCGVYTTKTKMGCRINMESVVPSCIHQRANSVNLYINLPASDKSLSKRWPSHAQTHLNRINRFNTNHCNIVVVKNSTTSDHFCAIVRCFNQDSSLESWCLLKNHFTTWKKNQRRFSTQTAMYLSDSERTIKCVYKMTI